MAAHTTEINNIGRCKWQGRPAGRRNQFCTCSSPKKPTNSSWEDPSGRRIVGVPQNWLGHLERHQILSREVQGSKGLEKLWFTCKKVRWVGFFTIGYKDLSIGCDPLTINRGDSLILVQETYSTQYLQVASRSDEFPRGKLVFGLGLPKPMQFQQRITQSLYTKAASAKASFKSGSCSVLSLFYQPSARGAQNGMGQFYWIFLSLSKFDSFCLHVIFQSIFNSPGHILIVNNKLVPLEQSINVGS